MMLLDISLDRVRSVSSFHRSVVFRIFGKNWYMVFSILGYVVFKHFLDF